MFENQRFSRGAPGRNLLLIVTDRQPAPVSVDAPAPGRVRLLWHCSSILQFPEQLLVPQDSRKIFLRITNGYKINPIGGKKKLWFGERHILPFWEVCIDKMVLLQIVMEFKAILEGDRFGGLGLGFGSRLHVFNGPQQFNAGQARHGDVDQGDVKAFPAFDDLRRFCRNGFGMNIFKTLCDQSPADTVEKVGLVVHHDDTGAHFTLSFPLIPHFSIKKACRTPIDAVVYPEKTCRFIKIPLSPFCQRGDYERFAVVSMTAFTTRRDAGVRAFPHF